MTDIYITYNSRDKTIAEKISAGLKKQGHTITVDVDVLVPGQDWRSRLMRGIEECTVVVAVITENSLSAQYVLSEIGAARALKKILIPVIVGDLGFPLIVQDLHCIKIGTDEVDRAVVEIDGAIPASINKTVFIVHGHDEASKFELKDFLIELGLRPIILHQQDDEGKAIIEKFETHAERAAFAFILMTPDDQAPAGDSTESKWRARQNVIMELGWFMAKLGRKRVVLLHKGTVELPSDILGILYLGFQGSVLEQGEKIRQRLKGVGLIG